MEEFFPDLIKNLPEADLPFEGVKGHLMQGEDCLTVFFEMDPIGAVEEHKHGAQWGVVFEGEMDLTIEGKTKTYKKGDRYYIPANVLHSAVFKRKTYLMDVFEDKHRYLPKSKK